MEKTVTTITEDLQKFIQKFEPNKFKFIKSGIEIRGINNIPKHINEAKDLIKRMELKLTVVHNAEMLCYGGFEVNNWPAA